MKRVVVTGMGIVSSIGNNTQEVLTSLREGRSGIVRADRY
ncbi:MAG: beta-ketoacyl synthase N-terminal-like domain-containing protein, partial [Bauldia litoralis]